jgi:GNAT superfamily N-acetyltransferase
MRALAKNDIARVKEFSDEVIGLNYFSETELLQSCERSHRDGISCSFVLVDEHGRVLGLRLAFPPGNWHKGKGAKLRPDLWTVSLAEMAYFQSLFLHEKVRGQGWGPKLSMQSLEAFKKVGAKAVLTHAWKESPNNSSIKYLQKLGFATVATHLEYWIDVDYVCVRDGKPCRCTAVEMILYL